jgi:hypothetical protein
MIPTSRARQLIHHSDHTWLARRLRERFPRSTPK